MRVTGSPPSTAAAGRLAADRISARRASAGDDRLESLADDPLGVIGYVCARSGGVPPEVVADDVIDALKIIRVVRETLDRRELALLRMGGQAGLSWKQRAGALGLSSRQAAEQRALRLEQAASLEGTRSEVTARTERQATIAEDHWLAAHHEAIEGMARRLALLELTGEDGRDSVEAIAVELAEQRPSHRAIMAYAGQLLREVDEGGERSAVPSAVAQRARQLTAEWRHLRAKS